VDSFVFFLELTLLCTFVGWGDVGEGSPGGNYRDRCDPAVVVAEDVARSVFDRYRAAVIEAKS
jgi:hypothetical protein